MLVAVSAVLFVTAACGSSTVLSDTEQGFVRDGTTELRWFLDLPLGEGPFPAVVYAPGSGRVSASHETTVEFARELNRLGFAVMR